MQESEWSGSWWKRISSLAPLSMTMLMASRQWLVSPALLAGGVFFREVLGVVNEQVGAFSQLADAFIEDRIARLVVRGVNNDLALGFHAEAQAALRMIEPLGVYGAMIERGAAFVDIGELAVRGHLTHVHREIGIGHLFFQRLLQAAGAAGGVEDERVVAVVIERREKWDALDVVPVEVGKKNVRVDGNGRSSRLQFVPGTAVCPGCEIQCRSQIRKCAR